LEIYTGSGRMKLLEEPIECDCGFIMVYHDDWCDGVCITCLEEEE
jgi:hypothetical protein